MLIRRINMRHSVEEFEESLSERQRGATEIGDQARYPVIRGVPISRESRVRGGKPVPLEIPQFSRLRGENATNIYRPLLASAVFSPHLSPPKGNKQ
jgi:hypothetical protein